MFRKVKDPCKLRMFHNGIDWVIAYSLEDVKKIINEQYGPLNDDEVEGDGWREMKPHETFTMMLESVDDFNADYVPSSAQRIISARASVREWIENNGRGWLASTEF